MNEDCRNEEQPRAVHQVESHGESSKVLSEEVADKRREAACQFSFHWHERGDLQSEVSRRGKNEVALFVNNRRP